ncbi:hypothetical protein QNJ24_03750 [Macrococcus caseolyticus]|uniref:hypothetical protein n=1 Tax=Macrococcoides caseolyticum TaxID=69966 RepID=UPI0024BCF12F|nr:hypothetical protein [Macrococcus caseolyticus]MDJ1155207.1 hypothetical protein [Macrococcus caseolyticus]
MRLKINGFFLPVVADAIGTVIFITIMNESVQPGFQMNITYISMFIFSLYGLVLSLRYPQNGKSV